MTEWRGECLSLGEMLGFALRLTEEIKAEVTEKEEMEVNL